MNLNTKTTALVLIDLQKGTSAYSLAPYSSAQVVERAADLGRHFEHRGGLIVRVRVAFAADAADRLQQPVDAPSTAPAGGLPPDFSQLVPEIAALSPAIDITKRQWGAFHGTELDLQLRRRRIETIVLAGIVTNMGVESTAREAWQHGYAVVIAEDACSSMTAEMHRFAIEKILPRVSRVRSTAEIIAAF